MTKIVKTTEEQILCLEKKLEEKLKKLSKTDEYELDILKESYPEKYLLRLQMMLQQYKPTQRLGEEVKGCKCPEQVDLDCLDYLSNQYNSKI